MFIKCILYKSKLPKRIRIQRFCQIVKEVAYSQSQGVFGSTPFSLWKPVDVSTINKGKDFNKADEVVYEN